MLIQIYANLLKNNFPPNIVHSRKIKYVYSIQIEGIEYSILNTSVSWVTIPCMYIFRNKFSVKVSTYMMELYNDKLIDLFAKPGTSDDVKKKF